MVAGFWADLGELLPLEWLVRDPSRPAGGAAGAWTLEAAPLHGSEPLAWWSAGLYDGALRRHLLGLRRELQPQGLLPLVRTLAEALRSDSGPAPGREHPLLVPIPSWKSRPNPLPPLLAKQLSSQLRWPEAPLLARSRPVLGQHRLNRELRWANQEGAFHCAIQARGDRRGRRPLMLLDDILTTGATACHAAAALETAGWRVLGLACLARTPERRGS
ncbi:phosphoribosyltransferase superfamily protein [Cyanobium sp. NS01]|nr:phosphoribosyltransferase superfamily protein [Cyanobium sp. NS01]